MKLFCSYAFTGEDEAAVRARMERVVETLKNLGHDVYYNILDPDYDTFSSWGDFLRNAIANMKGYDTVLVIMTSRRRSEGMLGEVGAAVAMGKEIILAEHTSAVGFTSLPSLTDEVFTWDDEEELLAKLKERFGHA